jgi:hypothetical protein
MHGLGSEAFGDESIAKSVAVRAIDGGTHGGGAELGRAGSASGSAGKRADPTRAGGSDEG